MSAALARALSRTSLRVRTRRALTAACRALFVLGLVVCVGELLYQLPRGLVWLVAGSLTLAVASLAFALRVPAVHTARALDQAGALSGRVVAALELSRLSRRTPFMDAALRDAEAHLGPELPALAAPISARPLLLASFGALALLASLSIPRRPLRREEPLPAVTARSAPTPTVEVEPESTRALRASLRALAQVRPGIAEDPARELRALSEALAADKLSGAERKKLHAALEQARESERQRREQAREQPTTTGPEQRQLEQLQRPKPPEREAAPEPEPKKNEGEGEREGDQGAAEQYAQSMAQAADALGAGDRKGAAQALNDAAEALDRHSSSPQQREQRQREQLAGEQGQREREQFEQAARGQQRSGGGSEADPGGHAPGERRIGAQYEDQLLRGVHGEGPSRSQVIEGASEAGFASVPYRRVYSEYREHAEAVLERDHVPVGERFYVRRYFQLVQPRSEAP